MVAVFDILVFVYGFCMIYCMKSADLRHFEDYWLNPVLKDFFIDHTGVLVATDLQSTTVYYRNNSSK
jgi:hypothetical protein